MTAMTSSNSSPLSSSSSGSSLVASIPRSVDNTKRRPQTTASDELDRKRIKLEKAEEMRFAHHPVFWTKDVSVFLQFGDTRLKVNRARMASQSKLFEELFERKVVSRNGLRLNIPWSVDDGVDAFQMDRTGVSLKDFEALLTTMEDGIKYCYNNPSFKQAASLVRAAYFFEFETILDFATKFMEETFLVRLQDLWRAGRLDLTEAVELVLLGRNCDLPQLLKRAFYELGRAPDEDVYLLEKEAHHFHDLSQDDIILVMNLQRRLVSSWLEVVASDAIHGTCPKTPACPKIGCVDPAVEHRWLDEYRCDPIVGIEELKLVDWISYGLCSGCAKGRVRWLDERLKGLWEKLDLWLNLDTSESDENSSDSSDEDT